MPFGILFIMKIGKHLFINKGALRNLIQAYFEHIKGEYHLEEIPAKKSSEPGHSIQQKIWDRLAEPATIAGLALFLGFNSRDEFDGYERKGKFASIIKRARLQIEAEYEKKLDTSTGAMFVLKSMGWNERSESNVIQDIGKTIKVKIIETGPQPVASEKEVIL